ncbi:hypothetical protein GH714_024560 [Hevea brasiliensis]|uniref:Uncharacterized protein n=1 Tax=Hevea brasiliensis TaxID=3981 RepID=A0A6A6LR51_HEVBR|nr:hypothetical protein GH714_024560 [Hevea brasiliensis]
MVVSSSLSILPSACSFPSTSSIDSSSSIEDGSTEKFFHNNSIADFVRFERGSHRTSGELQTAVVSYRKSYFTTLQKELEPYDCVLYQMVASSVRDMGSQTSEYPEIEALSRLDFGAAMKVFLAKRLTSEFTQVTTYVEERSVIIGERNKAAWRPLKEQLTTAATRLPYCMVEALARLGKSIARGVRLGPFPSAVDNILV